MVRSTGRPVTCADCGALITGERIQISATEQLCEDCWPFFLRPVLEEKVAASVRQRSTPGRKSASAHARAEAVGSGQGEDE